MSFTPQERGKHRIYVYYNGIEVKGTVISLIAEVVFIVIKVAVIVFKYETTKT